MNFEPKHPYHRVQNALLGGPIPGFSEGNDNVEKKVLGREIPNGSKRRGR